jgi:hypothetical protein
MEEDYDLLEINSFPPVGTEIVEVNDRKTELLNLSKEELVSIILELENGRKVPTQKAATQKEEKTPAVVEMVSVQMPFVKETKEIIYGLHGGLERWFTKSEVSFTIVDGILTITLDKKRALRRKIISL